MSLKQSGQLIFTGISGKVLTEQEQNFIEKNNIGGVVLFANNYENPAQLAELVNSIQKLRDEYPLFIAVDHEGGRVWRFRQHFSQMPPMFEIGKLDSPKICFELHRIMAEELSACGVNLNFAPCCDVLLNPNNKAIGDRSFSSNPEEVEKYISAAIRGLQTNGVMACAKHFPGHGNTSKDTHHNTAVVKSTLEEYKNSELLPFIKAAKSRVEMMMMSHVIYDCFDEDLPSTLSPKTYQFLRKECKYKKIIVTDDMIMKAITDHYSTADAAVRALIAGADMLIYRDMQSAMEALDGINLALKTKAFKNEVLQEKIDRIFETKNECLKNYKPIYIPEIENKISTAPNKEFLNSVLEKIVT